MNKIKVLFITKNMVINGISSVIMSYCESLDRNKYELSIISGAPVDSAYLKKLNDLKVSLIVIHEKTKNPIPPAIISMLVTIQSQISLL